MATAEELKDEGNTLYKNKEWLKAAAVYTKGIKLDPELAVLYSNRSAAFLQLLKVQKALGDAEICLKLRPTWEKGYYRKGCALEALEKFEEALTAFRDAAEHNPKNGEVTRKIANIARHVSSLQRNKSGSAPKSAPGKSGSAFGFGSAKSKSEASEPAVNTAEDYEAAKSDWKLGDKIPYDIRRVEKWAKERLSEAVNIWVAGDMAAYVKFLPGCKDTDGDTIEGQVAIEKAFDSPDTLENCVQFLRKYAEDMSCHAACIVTPKSGIAFPQVWKKPGWKGGPGAGFFVQVDSPDYKAVWFVPCGKEKGQEMPRDPISMDPDTYRMLPPLVAKAQ